MNTEALVTKVGYELKESLTKAKLEYVVNRFDKLRPHSNIDEELLIEQLFDEYKCQTLLTKA